MTKYAKALATLSLALGLTLPLKAQDLADARAIYADLCATCHGATLEGGTGSSLIDDEWSFGSTSAQIHASIENGLPERGMPPFGESLDDRQIDDLVEFILAAADDPTLVTTPVPDSLSTLDYELRAEVFADGLEIPWAIDFLSDDTALITERPGRLRLVRYGRLEAAPIVGTPGVLHEGQGGLLDVTVDPRYSENGWIYLAYSHLLPGPDSLAMTRIVRGRIEDHEWTDEEVLYEAPHETYLSTRHHYGSRIVFGLDGHLFFSIGDRGRQDMAQDLSRPNGKMHRILPDGTVPDDNPFVNEPNALSTIYSYGHRNPQGVAVHPETGEIWAVEHGPRGGDELNLVEEGQNYGWPVITYGINYSGTIITEERSRPGMEQPIVYWRPSIAVSGLSFYDGDLFPYWKNQPLVSALAYEEVRVLNLHDGRVLHQEVILKDAGRVREAVPGPDGAIYVVLNEPHRVIRLVPASSEASMGG